MFKRKIFGALAALALSAAVLAPQTAEARIHCHAGWVRHGHHCVRVHHRHHVNYVPAHNNYHPVRYVPVR